MSHVRAAESHENASSHPFMESPSLLLTTTISFVFNRNSLLHTLLENHGPKALVLSEHRRALVKKTSSIILRIHSTSPITQNTVPPFHFSNPYTTVDLDTVRTRTALGIDYDVDWALTVALGWVVSPYVSLRSSRSHIDRRRALQLHHSAPLPARPGHPLISLTATSGIRAFAGNNKRPSWGISTEDSACIVPSMYAFDFNASKEAGYRQAPI
ncbi:hypothetical protein B0H11DRAFT_1922771 [Mycena galericulata]|nr:hypothetical protein B0H11DRAFT_1922771 [Mycena galericulata]